MLNLELRFRRYEYFKKHLICTAGLMSETSGGFLQNSMTDQEYLFLLLVGIDIKLQRFRMTSVAFVHSGGSRYLGRVLFFELL